MNPGTFTTGTTIIDSTQGKSFPLGATVEHGGVNFSIYSKNADTVELLLFDQISVL